jgi:hypothetical protein
MSFVGHLSSRLAAAFFAARLEAAVSVFLAVVLSCMGNVSPDLQNVYCQAVAAWAPYHAQVREVRWCHPWECSGMGGAIFRLDTRTIAIDRDWPFKGDALLLTIEHEYGHALGLPHRAGDSIMKPGWDPPLAVGPTDNDFRDLQRLESAGISGILSQPGSAAARGSNP